MAGAFEPDSVIPFAPGAKSAAPANADLDKAGQTILGLLHKAAGVAESNSQPALELAQKFSHQLRAAEDRIAELEAEVENHREKQQSTIHGWKKSVAGRDAAWSGVSGQRSPERCDQY